MARAFFAFDLDGTITTQEILPVLAEELNLGPEFTELTRMAMQGHTDFASSLTLRFATLRHIPLAKVHETVARIPLDPVIENFIRMHTERCAVVTGNVDLWISPIIARLGCRALSSRARESADGLRLVSILNKQEAVRDLADEGKKVVAIGDGANDIPMFTAAHAGIAYGGVNAPPPQLIAAADTLAHDGAHLVALLSAFL
ncbi:MAG: Phosphoserine phosphatase SerB2 [Desulfovibrio sp.]